MNNFINNRIPEGTVLSVPKGPFEHVGIFARDPYLSYPTVISNSGKFGKVVEQTIDEFSGGKSIAVKGYPSNLPSWEVVRKARKLLDSSYNLFNNNCEHFVRKVHNQKRVSPQLVIYSIVGLIVLYLLFKD